MGRRRTKRPTLSESVAAHVKDLGPELQREAVLWWMDSTLLDGDIQKLHAPQPELAEALSFRGPHQIVPLTWEDLALIVATVRENSRQR